MTIPSSPFLAKELNKVFVIASRFYKVIFTVTSILLFISCKKENDRTIEFVKLERLEEVKIPIDNETPIAGNEFNFRDGVLYLFNQQKQRIQLYDWDHKRLIKKIQLESEGPNGVGKATSILVASDDSIYVISGFHFRLSLIDSTGKLLAKHSLIKGEAKLNPNITAPPTGGYSSLLLGNTENPFFKKNQIIVAGGVPVLDETTEIFWKKGKVAAVLDLTADTLAYVMPFPLEYLSKFRSSQRFTTHFSRGSTCFNENKNLLVTSFAISKELYTLNLSTIKYDSHSAGSSEIDEVQLMTKPSSDPMVHLKHTTTNAHYSFVKYDPVNKMYFRMVNLPNPKKTDQMDGQPWFIHSLVILDDNLNRLGEVKLDITTNGYMVFTENGVYVMSFKKESENEIFFQHYKVVDK